MSTLWWNGLNVSVLMKLKLRLSIEFAALIGAVPAVIALLHSLNSGATLQAALVRSLLTFVISFLFLLSAQLMEVRSGRDEFELSPWFVWFVIGGIILFFVGAIAVGDLLGGLGALGVWLMVVVGVWKMARSWKHKKA